MLPVIDQILVGLVGNDDQIALNGERGNLFRLGAHKDYAARILRGVVVDGPRLGRGELLQSIPDAVAARADGGHLQWPRLRPGHQVADRRPVRRED